MLAALLAPQAWFAIPLIRPPRGGHLLPQGEKGEYSRLMPHRERNNHAVKVAHEQREAPSRAESLLWVTLRDRGIGVKFRRQVPIGHYVVDFVCFEKRLIVESDGPAHDTPEQIAHDRVRDAWLLAQGFIVLRLPDDLVVGATEIAMQRIRQALASAPGLAAQSPSSDLR
jgi:very-short-patch-repair endonuclease